MRWSKVKKEVESRFADKLSGRVQLYITSYGQGYDVSELFNRGWITVDGKEVVNFSTPDAFYMHRSDFHHTTPIPNLKYMLQRMKTDRRISWWRKVSFQNLI